jgi:hypothetical protein
MFLEADVIQKRKLELNAPEGIPISIWDPAFAQPEVAARVGLLAYSRFSHASFDGGVLGEPGGASGWKRREIELRRLVLPEAHEIPQLGRSVRAVTIGEIFKKYNYGPRGQVCFHAQWVTVGCDTRGAYFIDATVGQVFGSNETEVGLQVRFLSGDQVLAAGTWTGVSQPNENGSARLLGKDPRLIEWFPSLTAVIVELRVDCRGP